MTHEQETKIRNELLVEHQNLLAKVKRWRSETIIYRWLNISLFMACKFVVPTGALIISINMISMVLKQAFIDDFSSAVIAIVVTFLASLEAMLNPGAKKRLAFNLYNELNSIENRLNLAKITKDNAELERALTMADEEIKTRMNHYSENGY